MNRKAVLPFRFGEMGVLEMGNKKAASRAKRYPLCFSGNFRRRENCPLLVRGNAPKTPLNAQDARLRVSAKRLGA